MKYQDNKEHVDRHEELSDVAAELRSLWHRMMRGMEHPPELQGLQRQQFWVLGALNAGPRRMTDLAECAQTSQASLTGIVDRLEEHGLARRVRPEGDRRVVQVELTEQGRRVFAETNDAIAERLGQLVEPLTPSERAEFLRLLRKVTAHKPDK